MLDRFTWRRTAERTAEHYYLELEAHERRRHDMNRGAVSGATEERSELAGAPSDREADIPPSSEGDKASC